MTKILSQAGNSLADVYDVEGSIAGIEQLETRELPIVHEMGSTVFSERLGGEIVRLATGDLLQSAAFDVILTSPPTGIWRVLGLIVLSDTTGRVDRAQVSLRDPGTGREMPIFVWQATPDIELAIRIVENNQAVTSMGTLRTVQTQVPNLAIAEGQPRRVGEEIVFRGSATAFGAGTVELIALLYLGVTELTQGAISSRGLPVPGW